VPNFLIQIIIKH